MSKLIEVRKSRGESQEQAAKGIGIAQSMLAMMESGDRRGSDATKTKVAKYYGITVGALFLQMLSPQVMIKEAVK